MRKRLIYLAPRDGTGSEDAHVCKFGSFKGYVLSNPMVEIAPAAFKQLLDLWDARRACRSRATPSPCSRYDSNPRVYRSVASI
jgi:hypothetical protein